MTDEEIAARALWLSAFGVVEDWDEAQRSVLWAPSMRNAAAVVAALREAGRLVPEGCVAVPVDYARKALGQAKKDLRAWETISSTRLATDQSRKNRDDLQTKVIALEIALEPKP